MLQAHKRCSWVLAAPALTVLAVAPNASGQAPHEEVCYEGNLAAEGPYQVQQHWVSLGGQIVSVYLPGDAYGQLAPGPFPAVIVLAVFFSSESCCGSDET